MALTSLLSARRGQSPSSALAKGLRADAHFRERSVARVMALACLCVIPAFVLLGRGEAGKSVAIFNSVLFFGIASYYGGVLLLIAQGQYHPAIAWANVFVEVLLPVPVLLGLHRLLGAEAALGAAVNVAWSGLVMLSALRLSARMCLVAGAVAASANIVLYLVVLRPDLAATRIESFTTGEVALRSFILLVAGFGARAISRQLERNAAAALTSVRARDLMGKYFMQELIGAGGMAEVHRAIYCPEGGFEKVVAVKRLLPALSNDAEFTELFRAEARLGAMLQHPNVVQVFDVGVFEGSVFMAMEHVAGSSLARVVRSRSTPLPLAAVSYLGAELAAALEYIHLRTAPDGTPLELVHRDLNPPNVLLSRYGEVKLSDFGVARAATEVQAGEFAGKLEYMAPEQLARQKIDGRADLFALGLTLHETLTGRRLIRGVDFKEVARALTGPHAAPSAMRPDVPAELDAVVLGLLAVEPAARPSAAEVRRVLTALSGAAAPYPEGRVLLAAAVAAAAAGKSTPEGEPVSDAHSDTLLADGDAAS